jgi:transposase-like protein
MAVQLYSRLKPSLCDVEEMLTACETDTSYETVL